MTTPELKREIKPMIIEALQIRGVTPEQVADDALALRAAR